ncbi:hypothetical protein L1286_05935 [Pseudoalteromonas sp. SMS1]|uniref:BRcat domain-containing protein n=1 Tax=Pseudoalteromonas sp. SMS1 TaxID=2908894 RepID=UPI001F34491B|nr:hypothetical protein [Pseudoalteromonas sp. SMS1]MCF2856998.1 hypothetical protein [Pseudoalteromonas sp. SMS1]
MPVPSIPNQIDSDPIAVQEKFIRQFDCPNPDCDESIDITKVNVGTKIQCSACKNVTWLPDYGNSWWQKPASIFGGLVLSFIIGVGASLTANWIDLEKEEQTSQQPTSSNNSSNSDTSSGAGS